MYFLVIFFGKASDDRILPVVIIGIVCAIFFINKKREKVRTEKLTKIFRS